MPERATAPPKTAPRTRDRILAGALASFGTRGFEATSLDAVATELGIRKQTILYYFPAKDALLAGVIDFAAAELVAELDRTVARSGAGWARIDAVIRKAFRLGARRPALLGLLREVTRLGPPHSARFIAGVEPLAKRALGFLEDEMAAGRLRRHDPATVLFTAYWAVIGMATEVEAQRALGEEPTLRHLVRRREALLRLLRAALEP
ncbi:MAG: TetR/AcrR family transcriptional regulator [Acidimicrobiia bacterium]